MTTPDERRTVRTLRFALAWALKQIEATTSDQAILLHTAYLRGLHNLPPPVNIQGASVPDRESSEALPDETPNE